MSVADRLRRRDLKRRLSIPWRCSMVNDLGWRCPWFTYDPECPCPDHGPAFLSREEP